MDRVRSTGRLTDVDDVGRQDVANERVNINGPEVHGLQVLQ